MTLNSSTTSTTITLPYADDFHVHLRQGNLMSLVTPMLRKGGCRLAYVMPNLRPPVTTVDLALQYKAKLQALAPDVEFLMTLYLTPELTPEEIRKAKKAGIAGVKSYPRGVTTNSDSGIESYETYYPVFKAMEEEGLVLNLHGEIPSDHDNNITVLNAEEKFLPHLISLHKAFPNLRIVLEHATSAAAIRTVKSLGDTVACTLTVHHLELVVDDWAGQNHHFCKPVAKTPEDREAIRSVIKEGHPRFFLGTDSAPHPRHTKECAIAHAGVFTTPLVVPYLVHIFDSWGCLHLLENFMSGFGRKFYNTPLNEDSERKLSLVKKPWTVPKSFVFVDDEGVEREIVPFLAGKVIEWQLV